MTKLHGYFSLFNSCIDLLLKTIDLNPMMALHKKLGDHQNRLHAGNHDFLFKIFANPLNSFEIFQSIPKRWAH